MPENVVTDFPPGPLSVYRELASFNWKGLKVFLRSLEQVDFEERMSLELQKYPEYYESSLETPELDEIRRLVTSKMFSTRAMEVFKEIHSDNKKIVSARLTNLLDPSTHISSGLGFGLFPSNLGYMGTERHREILEKAVRGEIIGCFALTEIGHGSNTKGMRTTATYDIESKEFIINSPDFEAAKCWVGLLGHTATHAAVFAHLTTPDGVKRGLHTFLVPLRNPYNLTPYPGVKIMDMGEKIGLNGVDNGVVMFDQYRIPRENLLNRLADVDEHGTYITPFQDPSKLHGASFGNLSEGRISITLTNVVFLTKAITISIRYAAVRKQFGIGEEEIPLLEYQTHQYRLIPYLAAAYCLDVTATYLFQYRSPSKESSGGLSEIAAELHAISSASKPVSGWIARDAIQESREACGGHGYLKAAGLGAIRNNQDACLTYEGANHVLMQQTSTWLLKQWMLVLKGQKINTPFKTLDFLNNASKIANSNWSVNSLEEIMEPKNIIYTYQWLVHYLLKGYYEKIQSILKDSKNPTVAKNNSQVYLAIDLAKAYIEHFVLVKMLEKINQANDPSIKLVLTKLMSLYGLWSLHKHATTLYIGGFASGAKPGTLIQEAILKLCSELKDDAVSLIDAIAPPDFTLHSVLGYSDGQVYKHLEAAMLQAPGALSRPAWWKEIVYWKEYLKPKL